MNLTSKSIRRIFWRTMTVIISDTQYPNSVAIAAPSMPNLGISTKFITTFNTAPLRRVNIVGHDFFTTKNWLPAIWNNIRSNGAKNRYGAIMYPSTYSPIKRTSYIQWLHAQAKAVAIKDNTPRYSKTIVFDFTWFFSRIVENAKYCHPPAKAI